MPEAGRSTGLHCHVKSNGNGHVKSNGNSHGNVNGHCNGNVNGNVNGHCNGNCLLASSPVPDKALPASPYRPAPISK